MAGGPLRTIVGLAVTGAVAAALIKRLRGGAAPQFSNHPTVAGGPDFREPAATQPAPPAAPEVVAELEPGEPDAVAELEPGEPDAVAELEPETSSSDDAWVEPVDGACPDGYPIKAKLASGIFHQPGGFSYERTKPDRCYPTAEAAEADGLRPAKR